MSDVAQPVAEPPKSIKIKVVGQNMECIGCSVNMTTPILKIKTAYVTKFGFKVAECRFVFDGKHANDDATPASLGMEDGDELEVYRHTLGGGPDN